MENKYYLKQQYNFLFAKILLAFVSNVLREHVGECAFWVWWLAVLENCEHDEPPVNTTYARHAGRQFDLSKDKSNERERTRSGGLANGVSSESAQLITDYKGNEYQRLEYTPYGELWIEKTSSEANTKYLPYKFTGKERDEETGLYYYGARYLDPKYSRWLSTDPALGEYVSGTSSGEGGVYNHVNLSLYHYGGNNPIKYTDPNGMWIDNEDGTSTAQAGDTLWDKYGADWKEKSGFDRDPRTLQVGETVGIKNEANLEKSQPSGDIMVGLNLNFVGMIGLDVSVGLVFDLDNPDQSGLFLSGGFAAGVSLGASFFGGYTSGEFEDKNALTFSLGAGHFGGNVGIADNGKLTGTLGVGGGLDFGFNVSKQHGLVIPCDTPDKREESMRRYYEHH